MLFPFVTNWVAYLECQVIYSKPSNTLVDKIQTVFNHQDLRSIISDHPLTFTLFRYRFYVIWKFKYFVDSTSLSLYLSTTGYTKYSMHFVFYIFPDKICIFSIMLYKWFVLYKYLFRQYEKIKENFSFAYFIILQQ